MPNPMRDWRLLSLAPAEPDRVLGWFRGMDGLDVRFPAARTQAAVREAIVEAEIVVNGLGPIVRRRSLVG